jgi:hypothetical protein
MNKNKILFLGIFTVLGLLAFQVTVNKIVGSGQSFTLFELLGPVGGMFLGPVLGAISAFFVRALNVVILKQPLDLLTVIRFLPAMLAAVYFGVKSKKTAIVFPICIALFLLNPIGRQAWLYSFIWLIPFTASFFKNKLILNSLGATFTAHAVGSVIFLYTFGLTPAVWMSLIPVVFIERGVFTIGIWASALAFNFVLDKITNLKFALPYKSFVKTNLLFNAGKSN